MLRVTGLNHITLATSNLIEAIRFYKDILDFDVVATWDSGAYLLAGDLWF